MSTKLEVDPRAMLRQVAKKLSIFGYILTALGVIVVVQAMLGSDEKVWRTIRGIFALLGWFLPGTFYLLFAYYLPRRRRWAITGAEVLAYLQLLFAGVLILVSLLYIRGMWPVLIIAIVWIVPLLLIPKWMAPCSQAMDLIVTLPTLGLNDTTRRESRRPK